MIASTAILRGPPPWLPKYATVTPISGYTQGVRFSASPPSSTASSPRSIPWMAKTSASSEPGACEPPSSDEPSDESAPLSPKAAATRRANSCAACGWEAADAAGCSELTVALALTLAGGMHMLSLHGWYSSVTATSAVSGLKPVAALSGTVNFIVPVKTESFSPPENAGAISSAGGYVTAPAFTAGGGVTDSVVRMKSAELGWLELICHPGRISASTSSWLMPPGLSAPPSLSVSILTTSDGFG